MLCRSTKVDGRGDRRVTDRNRGTKCGETYGCGASYSGSAAVQRLVVELDLTLV
jgi:hypothetical protein